MPNNARPNSRGMLENTIEAISPPSTTHGETHFVSDALFYGTTD